MELLKRIHSSHQCVEDKIKTNGGFSNGGLYLINVLVTSRIVFMPTRSYILVQTD